MDPEQARIVAALGSKDLAIIKLETVVEQQKATIDALSAELQEKTAALAEMNGDASAKIPVTDDAEPGGDNGVS